MLPSFAGERPVELLTAKQRARLTTIRRRRWLAEHGDHRTLEQVAAMSQLAFMTAVLHCHMRRVADEVFWGEPSPLLAAMERDG